jgi:TPR repeat protein
VLNDPVVQRCRLFAARRADPKIDNSVTAAVEIAAQLFDLPSILDAVAACRIALQAYPNEPSVIIPHYIASEALSALMLGIKFPDSDEVAFDLILQQSKKDESRPMLKQMMGFFLGSAYEYGIGTKPDRAAAMKWYTVAAEAGDTISKRELTRLQSTKQ